MNENKDYASADYFTSCTNNCDLTACPHHPSNNTAFLKSEELKGISAACAYLQNGEINPTSPAVCCNYLKSLSDEGYDDAVHYCCNVLADCTYARRHKAALDKLGFKDLDKDLVLDDKKYLECNLHDIAPWGCGYNNEYAKKAQDEINEADMNADKLL